MANTTAPKERGRTLNVEIRFLAETLLNDSKAMPCSSEDTVNIDKVIKHLGFKYFEFNPSESSSSNSEPDLSNIKAAVFHKDKKIFVNNSLSPQERNFALAHEIGHVLLHNIYLKREEDFIDHVNVNYYKDRKGENIPIEEKEANVFAYELLMPISLFKQNFKLHNGDTRKLAELYCLTEKRVKKRVDFDNRIVNALKNRFSSFV